MTRTKQKKCLLAIVSVTLSQQATAFSSQRRTCFLRKSTTALSVAASSQPFDETDRWKHIINNAYSRDHYDVNNDRNLGRGADTCSQHEFNMAATNAISKNNPFYGSYLEYQTNTEHIYDKHFVIGEEEGEDYQQYYYYQKANGNADQASHWTNMENVVEAHVIDDQANHWINGASDFEFHSHVNNDNGETPYYFPTSDVNDHSNGFAALTPTDHENFQHYDYNDNDDQQRVDNSQMIRPNHENSLYWNNQYNDNDQQQVVNNNQMALPHHENSQYYEYNDNADQQQVDNSQMALPNHEDSQDFEYNENNEQEQVVDSSQMVYPPETSNDNNDAHAAEVMEMSTVATPRPFLQGIAPPGQFEEQERRAILLELAQLEAKREAREREEGIPLARKQVDLGGALEAEIVQDDENEE